MWQLLRSSRRQLGGERFVMLDNGVVLKEAIDMAAGFGKERRFAEAFGMGLHALPLDDEHKARGVFDAALHHDRAAPRIAANHLNALLNALREVFLFAR